MAAETELAGRLLHPAGEGVVFGPGAMRRQLPGLLARLEATRPFLVTTPSVARAGLADEVAKAVGPGLAGTFEGSKEHTPAPVVLDAAAAAGAVDADCLVSLGGSSVVDLAKGVALVLAEGKDLDQHRAHFRPGEGSHRPPLRAPKLPHVAVPTTLSGAEFTGGVGITDPVAGEKRIYADLKLTPRWVVLDPELARATPPALWAATGMKALADTIEVLCSPRATPLTDAVAVGALTLLVEHLSPSTADDTDLAARGRCQFAVAMALPQLASAGVGLVAALRHQLGGGLGVAHGVASTIVLPHVLRWNAPACGEALGRAASAMGLHGPASLIGRVEALTAELGLPRALSEVGVHRGDLPAVADHVLHDPSIATNPRPVESTDAVLGILDAAW
ncbi:MAG: iron-containing alcohol dehydrogenase [Acidimicrobiia bacterium]|nr:iron-containing alcohol dehydrogenase [Acidimicrobiia bacterium]